jgi:energy-coupling factor transport system permease protein
MMMVFLTSNPLYLGTIGLVAFVVYASSRRNDRRSLDLLLPIWLLFTLSMLPLNLLTGSTGATPLFDLPELTLPGWLASVTFGGTVTAESTAYAASRAVGIMAIVLMVCAFNGAIDHFRLLKLVPPGLAQLGIVVTVALLLLPETVARATALREARLLRGHRGGVRAYTSLLIPLLAEALERSVQRAESLDARGFGRLDAGSSATASVLTVGFVAIAASAAFGSYYSSHHGLLMTVAVAASGAALVAVWRQGSANAAVRMRRLPLSTRDIAVLAAALAGASVFVILRATETGGITYLPFPEVAAPAFGPAGAAAALMLLGPALLFERGRSQ